MKNNKEFLEGVYIKAKLLEKERQKKVKVYNNLIRFSSVAAIFIILPLLFLNNQLFGPKNNIKTPEPRVMIANEPNANFTDANYILIGTINNVNEDIITIIIDNIIYGDIAENEIQFRLNNEGIEVSSNRSLFFLNKDKDNKYYLVNGSDSQFIEIERDVFVDNYGNKYTLEQIENNIKETGK